MKLISVHIDPVLRGETLGGRTAEKSPTRAIPCDAEVMFPTVMT